MNITNKDCFCYQCLLQFDSKHNHSLHLKLLHKQKNPKIFNKNELKSNKHISSEEKLVSNNQITSYQKKTNSFKGELCEYYSSRGSNHNVHIASDHEGKKKFMCDLCSYNFSSKLNLNKHISSVHERFI